MNSNIPEVHIHMLSGPPGGSIKVPEGYVIIDGWRDSEGLRLTLRKDYEPEADELPHCQHCNNVADERSFMCDVCAAVADIEVDDLTEQLARVRKALSDHERDRKSLARIEDKIDNLVRIISILWCDGCDKRIFDCVCS